MDETDEAVLALNRARDEAVDRVPVAGTLWPGTIVSYDPLVDKVAIVLDSTATSFGDEPAIGGGGDAVTMPNGADRPWTAGQRVMAHLVPPHGGFVAYAIGQQSIPGWSINRTSALVDTNAERIIQFLDEDFVDPFGFHDPGAPQNIVPWVPGWYDVRAYADFGGVAGPTGYMTMKVNGLNAYVESFEENGFAVGGPGRGVGGPINVAAYDVITISLFHAQGSDMAPHVACRGKWTGWA